MISMFYKMHKLSNKDCYDADNLEVTYNLKYFLSSMIFTLIDVESLGIEAIKINIKAKTAVK